MIVLNPVLQDRGLLAKKRAERFVDLPSRFAGNGDLTELQNRKIVGMRSAGDLDDSGFIFSSISQSHRFYWLLTVVRTSRHLGPRNRSVALNIDLGFRNPAETSSGCGSRCESLRGAPLARKLAQLRATYFSASIPLVNPLAIWEEPTCAARHGWRERRTTARRALSVSQRVHLFLPPPSSLAGGVTRSRDHWVRLDSRALAYVRSIDQSVGRSVAVPTDREMRLWPISDRAIALHTINTRTHRYARDRVTSLDFLRDSIFNCLINYESRDDATVIER